MASPELALVWRPRFSLLIPALGAAEELGFSEWGAGFLASLDDSQRKAVERQLADLAGARRVTVYKLEDGKPTPVLVRLGASDGSNTEISGNVAEGDLLVTGERAAAR